MGRDWWGHPPFFYGLLVLVWSLFGYSIWITHLVTIVFAFAGVYFSYRLGEELKSQEAGIIASLCLFFSPLYFAQSGILNLDLPLTSLMVMTLYFFLKGDTILYFLCGACLVLTREDGIIFIFSMILYGIFKERKEPKSLFLKKLFLLCGIFIIFMVWVAYRKYKKGWLVLPSQNAIITLLASAFSLESLLQTLKAVFLENYHFLITSCIVISQIFLKKTSIIIRSFVSIVFGLFIIENLFLRNSTVYWLPVIYILLYLVVARQMVSENKKYLSLFLFMLIAILFFSRVRLINGILPRYFLVIYPFYFIISACCLVDIIKKSKLIGTSIVIIFVVFSIGSWHGYRNNAKGWELESNLEYLDQIKTHKLACEFIAKHYPKSTVLTDWPQVGELNGPELGYVTSPIRYIWFLKLKESDKQKIDLVYYSDQSHKPEEMMKFLSNFHLKLIKYYESNGKRAVIYEVIKERKGEVIEAPR
jgi:4-amino-4-deoxy-L-arabinose transferase-like glycosyltransferase